MEVYGESVPLETVVQKMGQPDRTSRIISAGARTVNLCSVEDKHLPQINSG